MGDFGGMHWGTRETSKKFWHKNRKIYAKKKGH